MFAFSCSVKKDGHPHPESNFISDVNNLCPQQTQKYSPSLFSSQYMPVNGCSVALFLVTSYWILLKRPLYSSSLNCFSTLIAFCNTFSHESIYSIGSLLPNSWNAKILSISEPLFPELLPSESGLYDVIVLENIISKFRSILIQDFTASFSIVTLSPSI